MLMSSTLAQAADDGWWVIDFVNAITLRGGYNTNLVLFGTALLGLAAGVIGVFAMLRGRALLSDAISHATLPGIAGAFLAAGLLGLEGRSIVVLLGGAAITGSVGVLAVIGLTRWTRLREDAAIAVVLSVFFGAGVVMLSYIQRNASSGSAGLKTFIFGQAATMRPDDVKLIAGIALVSVVATVLLLKEFAVVCFNDSFARVCGWPVVFIDILMTGLVVLVTVAGLQAVGILLVVALLIVPPAAARFWSDRLWVLALISGLIGAGSCYIGTALSASFAGLPTGAVIVLVAGGVFVFSMIVAPARGIAAMGLRRLAVSLRVAGDHLLEAAYDAGVGRDGVLDEAELGQVVRVRGWSWLFRRCVVSSLKLRRMVATGSHRDGLLRLTDRGVERGRSVSRTHALWSVYLTSLADISPSHVEWSVDQVEHVFSDAMLDRLERELAIGSGAGAGDMTSQNRSVNGERGGG